MTSAWQVSEWGLSRLEKVESECPEPSAGEVQVAFQAASLNYRDLLVVQGKYNPKFPRPLVPCTDGFGSIVAVGPEVDETLLKKSVITNFCPDWSSGEPREKVLRRTLGGPLQGTLQQRRNFNPTELPWLDEPAALTPREWATLPGAGVPAWNGLSGLEPGQTVLLIGSGGVSLFALAFAKMGGARTIAITTRTQKRDRLLALGADEVLAIPETEDWPAVVRALTGGRGVDHVVEVVGGENVAPAGQAARNGGQIHLIGAQSTGQIDPTPLRRRNIRLRGIYVGPRTQFEAMNRAIDQHGYRPVVDRVFPFAAAADAFAHLRAQAHVGKVVIEVGAG